MWVVSHGGGGGVHRFVRMCWCTNCQGSIINAVQGMSSGSRQTNQLMNHSSGWLPSDIHPASIQGRKFLLLCEIGSCLVNVTSVAFNVTSAVFNASPFDSKHSKFVEYSCLSMYAKSAFVQRACTPKKQCFITLMQCTIFVSCQKEA